jgi:hypothetical protein
VGLRPTLPAHPLATGLYTPTVFPAARTARAIAAATYVFPTPVSVPVMNNPGGFRVMIKSVSSNIALRNEWLVQAFPIPHSEFPICQSRWFGHFINV